MDIQLFISTDDSTGEGSMVTILCIPMLTHFEIIGGSRTMPQLVGLVRRVHAVICDLLFLSAIAGSS